MVHKADRFNEIDLLRGIACISVILFHYLSRGPHAGWMTGALHPISDGVFKYGYLGVHLFFMISGFVILLSAHGASPRSFIASRVSRLYPALWAAASLTAAATWLSEDPRFMVSPATYFINLTMFPHWFEVGYIDGAYWSLAVELHFYLYVLLALRLKLFRRIELLLAAWLVISAINAVRPMYPVEFWLNAKWAPLFVAGGVSYLIRLHGINSLRLVLAVASFVLAIHYGIREIGADTNNGLGHKPGIVVAIISSFFIVFTGIALNKWTLGRHRFIAVLGALTYPLYLLHSNIGYVVYAKMFSMTQNFAFSLAIAATLVLMLACAVHYGIEKTCAPNLRRWIGGTARPLKGDSSNPISKT